CQKYDYSPYSF
nr:immunoglobulin light chain junction region [Macaca mulatta]